VTGAANFGATNGKRHRNGQAAARPGRGGMRPDDETVVLVAEDDPDMAELYCQALGRQGFLVVIAEDGEKALRLAEEIAPRLICLDVRMPKLDGLQVLDRLRTGERTSTTPVVMVSNYDEPAMMERAGRLGAVRFLIKLDTQPNELAEILSDILELPERRKPGRLPVTLGAHPVQEAEQMIAAYRHLLEATDTILSELGPTADEQRRQISGYAAQFRAQLAYWHAVMHRADKTPQRARGNISRPG